MRLSFKINTEKFSSRFLVPLLLLAIVIFPCNSHDSNSMVNLNDEKIGESPEPDMETVDALSTEEKISLLFMPVIESSESPVFDSEKSAAEFPGGFMLSETLFKNSTRISEMISVLKRKFVFSVPASGSTLLPFVSCFGKSSVLTEMGAVLPDPLLVGASGSKHNAGLYASLIEKKYSDLGINLLLK